MSQPGACDGRGRGLRARTGEWRCKPLRHPPLRSGRHDLRAEPGGEPANRLPRAPPTTRRRNVMSQQENIRIAQELLAGMGEGGMTSVVTVRIAVEASV